MNWKTWLTVLAAAASLTACGGGGGGAGTPLYGSQTGGTTAVTASNLAISLSSTTVVDTDTAGVTATVTATDGNGKTVPGVSITYSVTGGIYTQSSSTTDSNGENKATVKIGSDKSNQTIAIVATDGVNKAYAYLTVTGAKMNSTANPTVVAPNASGSVIFRLLDASSNPLPNQKIDVQTTAGGVASSTTNNSGQYVYTFTAPATTGTLTVTATAGGVTASQDVLVQSTSTTIADADPIVSPSLEVNPSVVSVNTAGSTANSTTVRALFLGAGNQALQNVRVKFDLNGDLNNIGGALSASEIYTDALGYAITSYTPGTKSSPTDGVTIRACYSVTGTPANVVCGLSNQLTKTLTVTADAVSVTVGGDENIGTDQDLVYYRRYVVQVVDSAGRAQPGVTITPQVDLLAYAKGYWGQTNNTGPYTSKGFYVCSNEDTNRNNVITVTGVNTEDVNHDQMLEPRKADAAVRFDDVNSNGKTDANGLIILRVTYPRSVATWVKMALTVSGSVNGSEGRYTLIEWLPYPAGALTGSGAPAFVTSPYGVIYADVTLSADRTLPDGTVKLQGAVLTPCQNPAPPNELVD